MKIDFLFAWYGMWIGIFYDKKKRWIYILPIPTVGIIIKLKSKAMEIQIQLEKELVMRDDAPVKFDSKVVGRIESYDKNTGTARIEILPEYEQEIKDKMTDDIKRPPLQFYV